MLDEYEDDAKSVVTIVSRASRRRNHAEEKLIRSFAAFVNTIGDKETNDDDGNDFVNADDSPLSRSNRSYFILHETRRNGAAIWQKGSQGGGRFEKKPPFALPAAVAVLG